MTKEEHLQVILAALPTPPQKMKYVDLRAKLASSGDLEALTIFHEARREKAFGVSLEIEGRKTTMFVFRA